MKVAYVTTYDSSDVEAWSGTGNQMLLALQNAGLQTESISFSKNNVWNLISGFKKVYYTKLLSKGYLRDREQGLVMNYTSRIEGLLASNRSDVVFSPGTVAIAYLKTKKPIVFWTDATFAGMVDFYPEYFNLTAKSLKNGHQMEQSALTKCRLAVYSSEWAANTAIKNYDVSPSKIRVVPFGACINCNRDLNEIRRIAERKSFDVCKLLFLGVDWYRKGGDKAVAVADLLNRRGIRTELHVVGCRPPPRLPNFVKCHGFISKKTEDGRKYLDKLMSDSHFLILPSRAECYGLVFAEASSFGLPSLATNVGGILTAVKDGKNGQTFSLNENPEIYCDYIESFISSKEDYEELALSSFREYSSRLNWSSSGKAIYDLVQGCCG